MKLLISLENPAGSKKHPACLIKASDSVLPGEAEGLFVLWETHKEFLQVRPGKRPFPSELYRAPFRFKRAANDPQFRPSLKPSDSSGDPAIHPLLPKEARPIHAGLPFPSFLYPKMQSRLERKARPSRSNSPEGRTESAALVFPPFQPSEDDLPG